MSKLISASGTLTIQPDISVIGSGSNPKSIALGPGGTSTGQRYEEDSADVSQVIATTGNPGDAFEDLDAAAGLSEVHLVYIRSTAQIVMRLYAIAASLQATAGAFPSAFGGGEAVAITLDGVVVTVTFDIADQTAIQCAARINAAMALEGIATPRVSVVAGQLLIGGVATAVAASAVGQISVAAGAPATTLGLAAATAPVNTDAQGQDVTVDGLALMEFPRTGTRTLTKVQVSGQAALEVVATGRS